MPLVQILFQTSSGIGADFCAKVVGDSPSWPEFASLVLENENGKKAEVWELVTVRSAL